MQQRSRSEIRSVLARPFERLRATDGIVEQATEAELVNASAEVDRFGFFNDPQTGVALAATMKLVKSRVIPPSSRVVVISTAHGLKFAEFKTRFHQGELPEVDPSLRNLPVNVPADAAAVRAVIDGRITA